MGQYCFDDKEFGSIIISTRRGMKNIRSCVRNGMIELHVPAGINYTELCRIIDGNRAQLRQMIARNEKIKLRYHDGQEIECLGGYKIIIGLQQLFPGRAVFGYEGEKNFSVKIYRDMDFNNENVITLISRSLKLLAKRIATSTVIELAEKTSIEVGIKPTRFVIGSGLRKLGHCTPTGEIQLSSNLMFLPMHLAKFVILHELAHLTHFNHSPQFHALLNRYCSGNEKKFDAELKHFCWPI